MHDDVIKWKHFPHHWPFVRGIHRSQVNSPHKGQWRQVLMFSLICPWTNGWVNNRNAGELRRHRAHYDVIVMWLAHEANRGMSFVSSYGLFCVLPSSLYCSVQCHIILGRTCIHLGCTLCPLWRKNSRYIHFMRNNGVNYTACAIASWLNNDVNNVSCMVARLDWLWDCPWWWPPDYSTANNVHLYSKVSFYCYGPLFMAHFM